MNTLTLEQTIEEIIEEFQDMEEMTERYQYIIELARELDPLPAEFHTDQYKVEGCVSQVWLVPEKQGDRLFFLADSDAAIVKGLVSLLIRVYSGRTAEEIQRTEPHFLKKTGIQQALSVNRANGLMAMVNKMRAYAESLDPK